MAAFPKFLLLPLEIREQVYENLFEGAAVIYRTPPKKPLEKIIQLPGSRDYDHRDHKPAIHTHLANPIKYHYGIIVANKSIAREVISFVYRRITFTFHINQPYTASFRAWPRVIEKLQFLARIRKCRFLVDYRNCSHKRGRPLYDPQYELFLPDIIECLGSLRGLSIEVILSPEMKEDVYMDFDTDHDEKTLKDDVKDITNAHHGVNLPVDGIARQEEHRSVLWQIPIDEYRFATDGDASYLL